MSTRSLFAFCIGLCVSFALYNGAHFAYAQTQIEQLQAQISEKNTQLDEIQKQISKYESALNEVGAQKDTLQKAINKLELQRKKIQADINYTKNQISSTDLQINKLSVEIQNTQRKINTDQNAIRAILRSMNASDNDSFVTTILRQQNISDVWNAYANLQTVKDTFSTKVHNLSALRDTLQTKKSESTQKRNDLVNLENQYSDQHDILKDTKASKDQLLEKTKSKEANYQELLAQKKAARDKLQSEVQDIESKIQFILDPNTIPSPGTVVFNWPLKNIVITQYFGYTKFALSGAYSGSKHNGVDFGTPIGTKLYAPLSGTVRDIGNTDAVPGCYSWGKWILIDHPNGLSSLFAHLSQQSVVPGQHVNTGDIIGYTGDTGYVTGPHLHYTVYVTAGVHIKKFNEFKSVTHCGPAKSPFAAIDAYLNPLDYLPPVTG